MTHIYPVSSQTNEPETDARTDSGAPQRRQSESGNFFAATLASLKRAGLGRFFGVTPPLHRNLIKRQHETEQTGDGDNAETQQAKDIYQAMLDITGH